MCVGGMAAVRGSVGLPDVAHVGRLGVAVDAGDDLGVAFVHYAAFDLERVGQFAVVDGEGVGQEHESLDALVVGQVLLERGDASGHEGDDVGVAAQGSAA